MNYQKAMSKIWVILITVLIMGGLIGGGYYYFSLNHNKHKKDAQNQIDSLRNELAKAQKDSAASNTTSTSASTSSSSKLQIYANNTYGYRFQYPNTFGLIDYLYDSSTGEKVDPGKVVYVDSKAIPENAVKYGTEGPQAYFSIAVTTEQFGLSSVRSNSGSDPITDMTIDGEQAWKVVGSTPSVLDDSYSTHIYTNHGNFGFDIWWTNSDAAGTHPTQVDTIVASIKWL